MAPASATTRSARSLNSSSCCRFCFGSKWRAHINVPTPLRVSTIPVRSSSAYTLATVFALILRVHSHLSDRRQLFADSEFSSGNRELNGPRKLSIKRGRIGGIDEEHLAHF